MKTIANSMALILIVLVISSGWIYAQSKEESNNSSNRTLETNCRIRDKYDEFTKKRSVSSGPYRIYTESINLKLSTLNEFNYKENADHTSTKLAFAVFARWEDGIKILGLVKFVYQVQGYLSFTSSDSDPKIIFLLSNGEALTIVPSTIESSTLDNDGWVTQRQFFTITDSVWSKLRDYPPRKFRIRYLGSNGRSIYEKDFTIEEQNISQIPLALKCIDNLQLQNVNVDNNDTHKEGIVAEQIKPSGDTSTISLYKQWKLVATLNKDGIPINGNTNQITIINKDGTYKTSMKLQNGTIIESKGKYQIISNRKIIVFTTETGETSSSSIQRLSKSELEFKGVDNTWIYIVY